MFILQGKKNSAVIYAEKIDKETKSQLSQLLREDAFADSKIRIMPDTHTGRYTVVGTTMTLHGRISPKLLGVDIGCGVEVAFLEEKAADIDLAKLDQVIHEKIPAGTKVHQTPVADFDFGNLKAPLNKERALRSIGTLGGGNHFIELDATADGGLVLIVHSGSRQAGSDVATYYQEIAFREACKKERKAVRRNVYSSRESDEYECKSVRREAKQKLETTRSNAILRGDRFREYVEDVAILQEFADLNRQTMVRIICEEMGLYIRERFSCIHNYVDTESMILRKGAISARQNERVIIPLNMRDGAIIGTGLGNPEWNFSAPHGAGRACSRIEARYTYSVEEFVRQMEGIYTTTANIGSIDECPMAYKPPRQILDVIGDTVEIQEIIHPIYNFKAC